MLPSFWFGRYKRRTKTIRGKKVYPAFDELETRLAPIVGANYLLPGIPTHRSPRVFKNDNVSCEVIGRSDKKRLEATS